MDQPDPTDLASRPIQGRRLSLGRPVSRRVRRRRKVLAAVALASVATALLMLGALASWHVYAQRRLGWIELTNDGPPLLAQVLAEADEVPLGEPFSVMTNSTLALPAGDYRLRVHGVGQLGRILDHDGIRDLVMISFFLGRYLTKTDGSEPTAYCRKSPPAP
jgi:hypothetical protein